MNRLIVYLACNMVCVMAVFPETGMTVDRVARWGGLGVSATAGAFLAARRGRLKKLTEQLAAISSTLQQEKYKKLSLSIEQEMRVRKLLRFLVAGGGGAALLGFLFGKDGTGGEHRVTEMPLLVPASELIIETPPAAPTDSPALSAEESPPVPAASLAVKRLPIAIPHRNAPAPETTVVTPIVASTQMKEVANRLPIEKPASRRKARVTQVSTVPVQEWSAVTTKKPVLQGSPAFVQVNMPAPEPTIVVPVTVPAQKEASIPAMPRQELPIVPAKSSAVPPVVEEKKVDPRIAECQELCDRPSIFVDQDGAGDEHGVTEMPPLVPASELIIETPPAAPTDSPALSAEESPPVPAASLAVKRLSIAIPHRNAPAPETTVVTPIVASTQMKEVANRLPIEKPASRRKARVTQVSTVPVQEWSAVTTKKPVLQGSPAFVQVNMPAPEPTIVVPVTVPAQREASIPAMPRQELPIVPAKSSVVPPVVEERKVDPRIVECQELCDRLSMLDKMAIADESRPAVAPAAEGSDTSAAAARPVGHGKWWSGMADIYSHDALVKFTYEVDGVMASLNGKSPAREVDLMSPSDYWTGVSVPPDGHCGMHTFGFWKERRSRDLQGETEPPAKFTSPVSDINKQKEEDCADLGRALCNEAGDFMASTYDDMSDDERQHQFPMTQYFYTTTDFGFNRTAWQAACKFLNVHQERMESFITELAPIVKIDKQEARRLTIPIVQGCAKDKWAYGDLGMLREKFAKPINFLEFCDMLTKPLLASGQTAVMDVMQKYTSEERAIIVGYLNKADDKTTFKDLSAFLIGAIDEPFRPAIKALCAKYPLHERAAVMSDIQSAKFRVSLYQLERLVYQFAPLRGMYNEVFHTYEHITLRMGRARENRHAGLVGYVDQFALLRFSSQCASPLFVWTDDGDAYKVTSIYGARFWAGCGKDLVRCVHVHHTGGHGIGDHWEPLVLKPRVVAVLNSLAKDA